MEESRFKIVFEKLAEMETTESGDTIIVCEALRDEVDEIGELRRLVVETTEPDRKSYTTT